MTCSIGLPSANSNNSPRASGCAGKDGGLRPVLLSKDPLGFNPSLNFIELEFSVLSDTVVRHRRASSSFSSWPCSSIDPTDWYIKLFGQFLDPDKISDHCQTSLGVG